MTQKELLSLEHLKIAEVKTFVHIHTEDGWVLTDWNTGDDIKNYWSSVCMYTPIKDQYPDYRVITADEDKVLKGMAYESRVLEINKRKDE